MPRIQQLAPLLRPLAAPRTVTCRSHFRFSTAARICAQTPSAAPASPSPPSAPSQAPPAPPSTPQEAARAADLAAAEALTDADSAQPPSLQPDLPSQRAPSPKKADRATRTPPAPKAERDTPPAPSAPRLPPPTYHVARSASKNLPVYTDFKRGGNLHVTTVRKITGDARALRDELREWLGQTKEDFVTVNNVTGHVVVKGHCKPDIEKFLAKRGF